MQDTKLNKFPEEERTFETRVLFIKEIFVSKHTNTQIMAHCIQHKLGRSFEAYLKDVNKSVWTLRGEDPMQVLKRIDRK